MSKKKSHSDFVKEIKINNPTIEILGEYKNCKTKIEFKCECGNIHKALPSKLLNGAKCKKCHIKRIFSKLTYTHEEFLEKLKIKQPNLIILTEYIAFNQKIKYKCVICGNSGFTTPWSLLSKKENYGCTECSKRIRGENKTLTHDEFLERVFKVNPNIEILSTYVSMKKNVKCKCKSCSQEWYASALNVSLNGTGCPKCKESLGEKKITSFLLTNQIVFESQKRFRGCRHIRTLPFDFYLPKYNLCIEYDGEQHFTKEFRDYEDLMITDRDKIKTDFCKYNGISLLRIPYWQKKNIDKILMRTIYGQ